MNALKNIFKKYNNEIDGNELVVQDPNLSIWNLNKLCIKYNLEYDIERDFQHRAMYIIRYK